jgi:hypothetical protein
MDMHVRFADDEVCEYGAWGEEEQVQSMNEILKA